MNLNLMVSNNKTKSLTSHEKGELKSKLKSQVLIDDSSASSWLNSSIEDSSVNWWFKCQFTTQVSIVNLTLTWGQLSIDYSSVDWQIKPHLFKVWYKMVWQTEGLT